MLTVAFDKLCPFRTTPKAYCIAWGTFQEQDENCAFLPKSQVVMNEHENTVDVPEWLVHEKGLEEHVVCG